MSWNPMGRSAPSSSQPAHEALKRAVDEQRKTEPLAGAIVMGREILARLLKASNEGRGVHIETALARLAAMAGYACQAAVRAELVQAQGKPEYIAFNIAEANGSRYFFGDALDKLLLEDLHSVWGLVNGMAQQLGWQGQIELDELSQHVIISVGEADFGLPRLPEGHGIGEPPIESLKALWPAIAPMVKDVCGSPSEWPIAFGLAIQQLMQQGKGAIDPGVALRIVMECAVPMARVDLYAALMAQPQAASPVAS